MGGFAVCLLAGAYALTLMTSLPPLPVLVFILVIGVACATARRTYSCAVLLGFAWMGITACFALSDRLDPALAGETLSVEVDIAGFPQRDGANLRFVAQPLENAGLPKRIRLTWREPALEPVIGERWRVEVRLKRPRGYLNPGGFDYALWLFRERIGATGFVVDGLRLDSRASSLAMLARRSVVARIESMLPADDASAVLMALSVGARHQISRASWDRFAVTGTSHLMAISGLHIGLAATCVFILSRVFIAILMRSGNYRDAALIPAASAALIYATLTGFGIPAQRACLMIVLAAWFMWRRQRPPLNSILALSAIIVFLMNPLALLAPGFQLSFAAVAVLTAASAYFVRTVPEGMHLTVARSITAITRLGKLQMFLLLGLFPLTVLQFDRYSIMAPAINLLVLPLFSIGIVPLTLAGALLAGWTAPFGDLLLWAAYHLLRIVLRLLELAASLPLPQQTTALTPAVTLLAFATTIYVCLPAGWPGRKVALLVLLFVASWRPAMPDARCFEYTALDVGQGLALFVRTERHTLLFDTGPAFPGSASTATLVVEPFLLRRGVDHLDTLVISHADNDHAGGVEDLVARFSPASILSGDPRGVPVTANPCVAGQSWYWDDVQFEIIHPPPVSRWRGNNVSCMLRVVTGRHSLLIAGDIESPVERLLAQRNADLASDVVIVPHHGSATSSSQAFVDRTGATTAIVSTGFGNRWGFPKPAVVARWVSAGSTLLNTATSGAISQKLCAEGQAGPIHRERVAARRFWHDSATDSPVDSRRSRP